MRTPIRSRPWQFLIGTGAATVLAATVTFSAPFEPPQSDKDKAAEEELSLAESLPPDVVDVTDKVEVTINGKLRTTSRTDHTIGFSVKNTSDEDLQGPIVVLVEQTGIDGLELAQTDGTLSDDRPYVEIVGKKGDLKAGRTLRSEKLVFKTADALTLDQRNAFDLKIRVCLYDEAAALAARDAEADKIEGKSYGWKDYDKVAAVQEKWTMNLIRGGQRQVYGTAVGENDDGELIVKVYTERPDTDQLVPDTIDGIPVQITPIGQMFHAGPATTDVIYPNGRPRKGAKGNEEDFKPAPVPDDGEPDASGTENPLPVALDPTLRFTRPVPIGVSIANVERLLDLPIENSLCYSGTLACRVVDSLGTQYFLTNLHVGGALLFPFDEPFAMIGGIGDRVVQPSTGDSVNFCSVNANDVIGRLVDFETIFLVDDIDDDVIIIGGQLMDAALVQATPGAVGALPPADGYQTLKRNVVDRPYIGMGAQKYGRTTVYTTGHVTALNAISLVGYADNAIGIFSRQIEIANLAAFGHAFSQGGDSGSLVVQHKPGTAEDGRPLALLFAGGPEGAIDITIANPIAPVLTRFGVQIDDGLGGGNQAGVSGTMGGAIGPGSDDFFFFIDPDDDGIGGGE